MQDRRVGVVMITYNRREEALRSVGRLLDLPEGPRVVVVDNGSSDGTAAARRSAYPRAEVIRTLHPARAVPVPRDRTSGLAALDALRGAGRVLAERRRVPATVEARLSALDGPRRTSTARRYVG